ncbi:peptide-methionine (R)-S-oxide reductase MsrB [Azospirillum sp. SYSU D00513]|uniref:peptide-methionine (R)-S-oxide reductase MsrB n=1 Tax=Azospirillum sp. SYSU D00513 TaxID=2812561 RepID=UPI0032B535F0
MSPGSLLAGGFIMVSRRSLLLGGVAVAVMSAPFRAAHSAAFEVSLTEEEWRRLLPPERYAILRRHGTEAAGSSPLNGEKRKGLYRCAGCRKAAFSSESKYDSGTGWPSFTEALPNAVGMSEDRAFLLLTRTEIHCARCGGHFGHLFGDGPPPTGKRYCMNGLSLLFTET